MAKTPLQEIWRNCVGSTASAQLRRHNCVGSTASAQLRRLNCVSRPATFCPCTFFFCLANLARKRETLDHGKLGTIVFINTTLGNLAQLHRLNCVGENTTSGDLAQLRRRNCVGTIASAQLRRLNCVGSTASARLRRRNCVGSIASAQLRQ